MLYAAYHDQEGVTEAFIKNGVRHALAPLAPAAADPAAWDYEVGLITSNILSFGDLHTAPPRFIGWQHACFPGQLGRGADQWELF